MTEVIDSKSKWVLYLAKNKVKDICTSNHPEVKPSMEQIYLTCMETEEFREFKEVALDKYGEFPNDGAVLDAMWG